MVGYLASAFVARGADIFNTFHSRAGTQSEAPADWYDAPRPAVPLYVVVNARTGSAAESFAYTLQQAGRATIVGEASGGAANPGAPRSEEHTSELQSLMRISYAVFCLKKKQKTNH